MFNYNCVIMEKENIPAYRVAQVEDKIILAKFDKNDLVYKSFFDGIKLDEKHILVCATEMNTEEEIVNYVEAV